MFFVCIYLSLCPSSSVCVCVSKNLIKFVQANTRFIVHWISHHLHAPTVWEKKKEKKRSVYYQLNLLKWWCVYSTITCCACVCVCAQSCRNRFIATENQWKKKDEDNFDPYHIQWLREFRVYKFVKFAIKYTQKIPYHGWFSNDTLIFFILFIAFRVLLIINSLTLSLVTTHFFSTLKPQLNIHWRQEKLTHTCTHLNFLFKIYYRFSLLRLIDFQWFSFAPSSPPLYVRMCACVWRQWSTIKCFKCFICFDNAVHTHLNFELVPFQLQTLNFFLKFLPTLCEW